MIRFLLLLLTGFALLSSANAQNSSLHTTALMGEPSVEYAYINSRKSASQIGLSGLHSQTKASRSNSGMGSIEDTEDVAPIAGFVAYFAGAAGGVYLTDRIVQPDTSRRVTVSRVIGGHVGGSVATGLTVHLWNRRKGSLPETIGGAFMLPAAVLGGGLALGGLAHLVGLDRIGEGIIYVTAWISIGAPAYSSAGAVYMDDYTRP